MAVMEKHWIHGSFTGNRGTATSERHTSSPFEAFRQVLVHDPQRPYTGDGLVHFFDSILGESPEQQRLTLLKSDR